MANHYSPRATPKPSYTLSDISEHAANEASASSPRMLACRHCHMFLASSSCLMSTGFRGYSGKAALYADAVNVALAAPSLLLMDTGAHTVQELSCATCTAYLGWKIVRAYELPEKWKEGHYLLEDAAIEDYLPRCSSPRRPIPTGVEKDEQRRLSADSTASSQRGRLHGPRSLTPSLRNRSSMISVRF